MFNVGKDFVDEFYRHCRFSIIVKEQGKIGLKIYILVEMSNCFFEGVMTRIEIMEDVSQIASNERGKKAISQLKTIAIPDWKE